MAGLRGSAAHRLAGAASLAVFALFVVLMVETWLGLRLEARRVAAREELAGALGRPYDRRLESEVVRDLRGTGVNAVPSVVSFVVRPRWGLGSEPTAWRAPFLPLVGVSQRPSAHLCDDEGWRPVFESDEHGFANPTGLWGQDSITLVLVGDSFTHGYCTAPDSSYAELLRQRWPRTLNLGAGGAGPLAELGALIEYGAAAKPRLVVWQYYENDLEDLAAEKLHPILLKYLEPGFSQDLRSHQAAVDSATSEWVERVYAAGRQANPVDVFSWGQVARLTQLRAWLRSPRHPVDPGMPAWRAEQELMGAIMLKARDVVRGWGGEMIIVYVPTWRRYFDSAWRDDGSREAVLGLAQELGIPVVDMHAKLEQVGASAELFSRRNLAWGHFSAEGQALMAGAVAAQVRTGLAGRSSP